MEHPDFGADAVCIGVWRYLRFLGRYSGDTTWLRYHTHVVTKRHDAMTIVSGRVCSLTAIREDKLG